MKKTYTDRNSNSIKKTADRILIGVFFVALIVPSVLAHRTEGRISDMENRTLAGPPHLIGEDGGFNWTYPSDFDSWINDNVRFRTTLMKMNATLQYRLFHKVANNSLREGKEGHLFYAGSDNVREYQHADRFSEEELAACADSMQALQRYLGQREMALYYMPCFSKHSIYPEYFVEGVNRFGGPSKALQLVDRLKESGIEVIPVYEALMGQKEQELLYFKATDPAHWNESGAHIGYTALLRSIQERFPGAKYLEDKDYRIMEYEEYAKIYGFTYPWPERGVRYRIKEPKAVELELDEFDPGKVIMYREYGHYFVNKEVSNDLKILVIGDSYIRQFLKEHIAEGFSETLSIDRSNLSNLDQVLALYEPDLVVMESVEGFLRETMELLRSAPYLAKE